MSEKKQAQIIDRSQKSNPLSDHTRQLHKSNKLSEHQMIERDVIYLFNIMLKVKICEQILNKLKVEADVHSVDQLVETFSQ